LSQLNLAQIGVIAARLKRCLSNSEKQKKILGTNTGKTNIIAINGCCYGKDNTPDKGEYLKLCGQRFWEFISGNTNLYQEIIEPLGFKAKEKNESFQKEYSKILNNFSLELGKDFSDSGNIDWIKIVQYNSSMV
jgi:hypothetical protein